MPKVTRPTPASTKRCSAPKALAKRVRQAVRTGGRRPVVPDLQRDRSSRGGIVRPPARELFAACRELVHFNEAEAIALRACSAEHASTSGDAREYLRELYLLASALGDELAAVARGALADGLPLYVAEDADPRAFRLLGEVAALVGAEIAEVARLVPELERDEADVAESETGAVVNGGAGEVSQ